MPNLFPLLPHLSVSLSTCSYGHQVHQSCLSLLNKCTSLKQLKQVQAQTFKEAIGTDPYTLSKLIEFCALSTSNLLFYAFSLFILIPEPNLFVYNTMIRGSVRNDRPCEAILLYNQMRERNILPNNFSYPFLFNACEKTLAINHGLKLHGGVLRSGFCSDPFVMTTLLTMYAKFGMLQSSAHVFDEMAMRDTVSWNSLIGAYINHGDMEKAQWYFHRMPKRSLVSYNSMLSGYADKGEMDKAWLLFREMKEKDVISWNSILGGYTKKGDVEMARTIFDKMGERDVVSWTSMINGYVRSWRFNEGLMLFREMQVLKTKPSEITMLSVLSACSNLGALNLGRWVHDYIEKSGFKLNKALGTALIDMYGKCGDMDRGLEVFREMEGHERDVIAWTATIGGLAINSRSREALEFFSKMVSKDVRLRPDGVTFLGVLSACSHAGLVKEGLQYFKSMSREYNISPEIEHYGCMVDLLARAGLLKEAEEFVKRMSLKPDAVIWGSLFSASRIHNNVELGERVIEHLTEMEPKNLGNYVVLSNVYAAAGRWNDVAEVRRAVREKGVRRTPGCSSIETSNEVHEFVAGDLSHPRSVEIYKMLDDLASGLQLEGYFQDPYFFMQETD